MENAKPTNHVYFLRLSTSCNVQCCDDFTRLSRFCFPIFSLLYDDDDLSQTDRILKVTAGR